jgi:hypothetical protein
MQADFKPSDVALARMVSQKTKDPAGLGEQTAPTVP